MIYSSFTGNKLHTATEENRKSNFFQTIVITITIVRPTLSTAAQDGITVLIGMVLLFVRAKATPTDRNYLETLKFFQMFK